MAAEKSTAIFSYIMIHKMKKLVFILAIQTFAFSAFAQNPAEKLRNVFSKTNKNILVAAHRGDWRNAPENSMKALLNSIDKGFDLMELDLKMTKDSQLVVMHDNTIDRTTNGKGKVSDFTLGEILKFRLKNGLGRVTTHPIPLFKDMMLAAKGKIVINVDKGNDHLKAVFEVLQQTQTLDQSIVNVGDNVSYAQLIATQNIPKDAYLMVVVNMKNKDCLTIIDGYKANSKSIIQPVFDTDTLDNLNALKTVSTRQVLWLNSLWPSLNGGHDDDRAVEEGQKKESWGWLISKNPKILQTDRPSELLIYLKQAKLHD